MESYFDLRPGNHLVGNVQIVRVDIKSGFRQNFGELAAIEYTGYHCTIEGVLEVYQKLFDPLLVSS